VVVVGVEGCAVGLVVVAVGVGVAVLVGVAVGDLVGVPDERALAEDEAVADWLDVPDVLEVAVCEEVAVEEKIAGTLDPEGPVHAETAAETTTIKVAQLRTVSRVLPAVPGKDMRAFMKPP
jgi:hypothetical protein